MMRSSRVKFMAVSISKNVPFEFISFMVYFWYGASNTLCDASVSSAFSQSGLARSVNVETDKAQNSAPGIACLWKHSWAFSVLTRAELHCLK